jgi:hypothetical protein
MVQSFPMVPAAGRVYLVAIPVAGLALFLVAFAVYLAWSPRHVQFEVSPGRLRIRGDLYGRTISISELKLAEARLVNLDQEPDLRPVRRTNGTGLPGYSAGWFRLAGGRRGLLFLTERQSVVMLPDSRGWVMLLSVADGSRFLDALKNAAR